MQANHGSMTCKAARPLLGDHVAGELDAASAARLEAHLAGCAACARAARETAAVVGLLRRAGSDEAPPDFALALHNRLVADAHRAPPRPSFGARLRGMLRWQPLVWAMAGAAAALLVVFAMQHRHPATAPVVAAGEVAPTFRIPAHKLAVIKIDFQADTPVDDVAFAVTLPEGLRFVSRGKELAEHEFRWTGRLDEGSNLIPVAVRGARAGFYTVAVRASGAGVDATHEVVLEVTSS